MKRFTYYLSFVLALSLTVVTDNGQAAEPISLQDAVEIGLESNFNIQIARNNAKIASSNSGKGRAGFLPTVAASANAGKSSTDVEPASTLPSLSTNDKDSWQAQIALEWTLFDGFKMFAEKKRFSALAKLGQAEARNLIETNVVAISRAYFNLVIAEQLLEVATESNQISKVRLDKEKIRRELGGSSSTDLLNAQVAYNADQAVLLDRELAIVIARQNLNLLLGRDADQLLGVIQEIELPELAGDRATLMKMTVERNAELIVIGQQRQVSEATLVTSKSKFMPRVALAGSYSHADGTTSRTAQEDITNVTKTSNVGLNLSWNLFNGGRDRIDYQNAQVELKNQHLAMRQTRQRLEGFLSEQLETYERRKLLVGLETQNVDAANANLEIVTERYAVGSATSLEFRDAQVQLVRVQAALITARHQTRLAHLAIERLSGSLSIH